MLEPFDREIRVSLCVVALGVTERLRDCLTALAHHSAETPFTIVCVVNPADRPDAEVDLPAEVHLVRPQMNLGWAGGLHAARGEVDAEYLVWIQQDMTITEGWLDALVAAADSAPDVGAFGSMCVDTAGQVKDVNAGWARPAEDVHQWNATDPTHESTPTALARFDWVTSKGMLARVSAWDEVGGADARLFPLNHVDKDYCTHLRAHGWGVALVPTARLLHIGGTSTSLSFRGFLALWQEPRFNSRWRDPVIRMAAAPGPTDHECSPWLGADLAAVEREIGIEASRMIVPFMRHVGEFLATQRRADSVDDIFASTSWRVTKPLRWAGGLARRILGRD
jgi:GT2 family glycosyltransferase